MPYNELFSEGYSEAKDRYRYFSKYVGLNTSVKRVIEYLSGSTSFWASAPNHPNTEDITSIKLLAQLAVIAPFITREVWETGTKDQFKFLEDLFKQAYNQSQKVSGETTVEVSNGRKMETQNITQQQIEKKL